MNCQHEHSNQMKRLIYSSLNGLIIQQSNLSLGDELGHGHFGVVYFATHKYIDQREEKERKVAVKKCIQGN